MSKILMQNSSRGFTSLISLLLTIAIIMVLCFMLLKVHFNKPAVDTESEKILSKENIKTSSYQSSLESTRNKIKDINQMIQDRGK